MASYERKRNLEQVERNVADKLAPVKYDSEKQNYKIDVKKVQKLAETIRQSEGTNNAAFVAKD